jgi:hypothetical protein
MSDDIDNGALIDKALAEMGQQARADEACPICHASVRPDRRDRHINWHASLARDVERERLPQVYGRVTPPMRPDPDIMDNAEGIKRDLREAQDAARRELAALPDEESDRCHHPSSSGIDQTPGEDPDKVWECHQCGERGKRPMTHTAENDRVVADDLAATVCACGRLILCHADDPQRRHWHANGRSAYDHVAEPRVIPRAQTQPPPGHEEPWDWHPDGPEAHALLEKIQDEEGTP